MRGLIFLTSGGGGSFDPASPGPIGATTPSTGAFTALSSSGAIEVGTYLQLGAYNLIQADGGGNAVVLRNTNGGWVVEGSTNTLALRRGTNGQTFIVSRSYTDGSNYSQLKIAATGSTVSFTADEAGTGVGTLTGYSFDRNVLFATDNTYDIGASGGGKPRNIYAGTSVIAGTNLGFLSGGYIQGVADGEFTFYNLAASGFDRLKFGGTTSAFPALRRTGSDIEIVKADGTAADTALILASPDGTRYRVTVANDGTLTSTAV